MRKIAKKFGLTKALLEEQEAEKQKAPVVPLYSYKVFERLSAGTGYTYFGDGNYDEVFYDEELIMTLHHGYLETLWNLPI